MEGPEEHVSEIGIIACVQVAATAFLTELGKTHTEQLKLCLPIIVPILTGATADSKLQVKVCLNN